MFHSALSCVEGWFGSLGPEQGTGGALAGALLCWSSPCTWAESIWSLAQGQGLCQTGQGDVTDRTCLQPSEELPSGALAPFCLHHFVGDHPAFVVQLRCHLSRVLGEVLLLSTVQKSLGFKIAPGKHVQKIVQAEKVALEPCSVGPCRRICRFIK